MATYPAGTTLDEITHFDRSTKVHFHCPTHPEYTFRSKDPFCSSIFPGDPATSAAEFQMVKFCTCPIADHVVTTEYAA
ncbi:hypothetical protein [Paenarthrobacter sp. TA1.8]|uniref:hypothetical protein n=1 Tax=Paenarthrobacter sp. TA1.8 TaxID=3400219 RepID=UPI003B42C712